MVKKTQRKNNKKAQPKPASTRRSRRQRRNGRAGVSSSMKMYADMLADPCNATLIPGLHSSDEGILARLKTIINVSSGNENGYLMWCPAYCGSRASDKIQFVVFTNSASNVGPLNTVAEPAFNGSNYSDTQGASDTVGAETFVQSATVSDFRLVSSCINLKYTGAMSASKGVIGYLENVPADTVLVGNAGNPATIDQIFNLTSHTARLGVNDHEIKYRPNATISGTFKSDRDSVYTKGVNGVSQTAFTSESLRFSPTFYGFAWKGVISSDMLFDVYQNIEWRPEAASGYVATVPKQLNAPGYLDMVKKYLDDNYPGWTTKAMNGAAYGAGRLASIALSGSFAPPSIRWRG